MRVHPISSACSTNQANHQTTRGIAKNSFFPGTEKLLRTGSGPLEGGDLTGRGQEHEDRPQWVRRDAGVGYGPGGDARGAEFRVGCGLADLEHFYAAGQQAGVGGELAEGGPANNIASSSSPSRTRQCTRDEYGIETDQQLACSMIMAWSVASNSWASG